MAQVIQIRVNSQLLWEVAKTDSGRWLAVCRPLKLTMEGTSLDELHDSIKDAVQLLLTDLLESGELDSFLQAQGWQKIGPKIVNPGQVRFDLPPVELLIHSSRDSARTLLQ